MTRYTFKLPGIVIGTVVALMLAACGGGGSGGGGGGTANRAPIANAGPAQSVAPGILVTLDGRASTDADGDALTYAWTLPTRPNGSAASLSGATTAQPTFTPDVAGTYTASLVVNDGKVSSAPATVTITATTPAPVANAGPAQSVIVPVVVMLDGSGSTAAAGKTLTYAWTLPTRPAGSAATISNNTSPMPTFNADVAGTYVASLVVNDGTTSSAPSTVQITGATANAPPVANAGPAQNVTIPTTVFLSGAGSSDPNGDALSYSWSFSARPEGSTAALAGALTVTPNFSPDLPGVYDVRLVVNDGQVNSAPSTVRITAATGNSAPIANAGPAQEVVVGALVTLDGSASSDFDNDPLTYAWSLSTRPTGSAAALTSPATVSPTFTADVAGIYVASLVVNDGTQSSTASTVSVTAFANNVIGTPYPARNDLTVTLTAFTVQTLSGGFTRYTASYTQQNPTAAPILEGSLRLYFRNAAPERQFLFPLTIAPGATLTRTYSFDVLSTSDPLLLQYDGDHLEAADPIFEAVQWRFPIQ
jgi:hypothetical protein